MKTLKTIPGQNLVLGHRGENLATRIVFSIAPWAEVYGPGTAHLLHQRKDDAEPYPVGTVQEGTQISWDVTGADTAVEGYGKYELRYYVGETMVKSSVGETFTMKALQYGSDAPDPIKGWVDHVMEKESEIYEAVNETKRNSEQAVSAAGDALNFANAAGESAKYSYTMSKTAEDFANFAMNHMANANTHEVMARKAADSAAQSAQNAATSEANAKEAENNVVEAEKVVVLAEESAVNAKEAAEEAERKAELSKQSADQSATNAEQSASEAKKAAEEAKKAAENAGGGSGVNVTAKPGQFIRVKEVDENGKPTAWEAVDPVTGADWNASEGEPGHVLNRTHWVEGGMVEIPVVGEWVLEDGVTNMFAITAPVGLEVGKTYVVTWNGTEYVCAAQDMGGMAISIGNASVFDASLTDTGEPFVIVVGNIADGIYGVAADINNEVVSFSIYQDNTTIHKLPGKFLPDGVPYVEKGGMVEILPECQPTYVESEGAFVIYDAPMLVVGETYTVNWNGTEYECIVEDDDGLVGLGADPFVIFCVDGAMAIMPMDGSTELTISIKGMGETIHKLPEEFLPESVDGIVIRSSTADSTKKFKLTVDDSGTISATEV